MRGVWHLSPWHWSLPQGWMMWWGNDEWLYENCTCELSHFNMKKFWKVKNSVPTVILDVPSRPHSSYFIDPQSLVRLEQLVLYYVKLLLSQQHWEHASHTDRNDMNAKTDSCVLLSNKTSHKICRGARSKNYLQTYEAKNPGVLQILQPRYVTLDTKVCSPNSTCVVQHLGVQFTLSAVFTFFHDGCL